MFASGAIAGAISGILFAQKKNIIIEEKKLPFFSKRKRFYLKIYGWEPSKKIKNFDNNVVDMILSLITIAGIATNSNSLLIIFGTLLSIVYYFGYIRKNNITKILSYTLLLILISTIPKEQYFVREAVLVLLEFVTIISIHKSTKDKKYPIIAITNTVMMIMFPILLLGLYSIHIQNPLVPFLISLFVYYGSETNNDIEKFISIVIALLFVVFFIDTMSLIIKFAISACIVFIIMIIWVVYKKFVKSEKTKTVNNIKSSGILQKEYQRETILFLLFVSLFLVIAYNIYDQTQPEVAVKNGYIYYSTTNKIGFVTTWVYVYYDPVTFFVSKNILDIPCIEDPKYYVIPKGTNADITLVINKKETITITITNNKTIIKYPNTTITFEK